MSLLLSCSILYKIVSFQSVNYPESLHFISIFWLHLEEDGWLQSLGGPRNSATYQTPPIQHGLINDLLLGMEREPSCKYIGENFNCVDKWKQWNQLGESKVKVQGWLDSAESLLLKQPTGLTASVYTCSPAWTAISYSRPSLSFILQLSFATFLSCLTPEAPPETASHQALVWFLMIRDSF